MGNDAHPEHERPSAGPPVQAPRPATAPAARPETPPSGPTDPASSQASPPSPKRPQGVPVPAPAPQVEEADEAAPSAFLFFAALPSWLVSMVLHIILILVLTLIYLPNMPIFNTDLTIGRPDVVENDLSNFEESMSTVDMGNRPARGCFCGRRARDSDRRADAQRRSLGSGSCGDDG